MIKASLAIASLLLAFTAPSASAQTINDGIMVLNEFEFNDAVKSNDYLLVYFFKKNW